MDSRRRFLLKVLATAPFTLRANCSPHQRPAVTTWKSKGEPFDIFLHGFFITEIQANKIVIASPEYNDHVFAYWDHTDNSLHAPPATPFPWIAALDRSGSANDFPDDLLHFSRAANGSGAELFIPPRDLTHRYAWYLELPLPSQITGVRDGGKLAELVLSKNSKTAQSVKDHCKNGKLKLITRLRYIALSPLKIASINLYAEHCAQPNAGELKDLFVQTSKVLPRFDFQLDDLKDGDPLPCSNNDNEKPLCELGKKLANNPCEPCPCPPGVGIIRTANCPQLGVIG